MPRILITGGPGSGTTTTARALGEVLGVPVFDSDDFFHVATDPPYQRQHPPAERRRLLLEALGSCDSWVLGGSIAAWGIREIEFTHAVLLNPGREVRLARLRARERGRFGARLNPGGDMHDEHRAFVIWAEGYETRSGESRSLSHDRQFLSEFAAAWIELTEEKPPAEVVEIARHFAGA